MAMFLIESLVPNSKLQIAIWAIELIFVFAGVISTVIMLKDVVFLYSFSMVQSSFEIIKMFLRSWLSSTFYIYMIINFMVVLIAVSTAFLHHNVEIHSEAVHVDDDDGVRGTASSPSSSPLPAPPPPPPPVQDKNMTTFQDTKKMNEVPEVTSLVPPEARERSNKASIDHHSPQIWKDIEEEKVIENTYASWLAVFDGSYSTEDTEIKKMNSLQSSHNFEEDNILIKDEDDSIEAMWKVINETPEKPLKHNLKKSDTFPMESRVVSMQSIDSKGLLPSAAEAWRNLRKSVTFNDSMSMRKRAGLIRESSIEALNSRVESFISKFNNAMRIERQESELRFLDMISRGV